MSAELLQLQKQIPDIAPATLIDAPCGMSVPSSGPAKRISNPTNGNAMHVTSANTTCLANALKSIQTGGSPGDCAQMAGLQKAFTERRSSLTKAIKKD